MSHQCTRCQTLFPDGEPAILNGCPSCGWNRFLFVASGPAPVQAAFPASVRETVRSPSAPRSASLRDAPPITPPNVPIESIRILENGRYEVNIRRLLERPEIVLGLKEDGKYLIHLPSLFERRKGGGN